MGLAEELVRAENIAWAAGLFEARGSWQVLVHGAQVRPRVCLTISKGLSNDPAAFADEIRQVFGFGSLSRPQGLGMRLRWQATGAKASIAVSEAVLPHMRGRKTRVVKAHLLVCRAMTAKSGRLFNDRELSFAELATRRALVESFDAVNGAPHRPRDWTKRKGGFVVAPESLDPDSTDAPF